ncbi:flagellar hook assembly protein FlgD [Paenibacillus puldeungensis]|uniref:Flagellar hook assembly protein FlgD n=1 Tax=Paenibacillus puldeungensis TaxID=696536 RepID=A0ABW3RYF1_9BACL
MADSNYPLVMWPNYSQSNVEKAAKKSNQLGKDDFLKLMMAQMQYQDPLSPMDNKDMVAQMAQFTSVEQLTNIAKQITDLGQSLGSESGLIGKQVSWNSETKTGNYDIKTGKAEVIKKKETGIVESIIIRDGVHYVKIGDKEIKISEIEQVENQPVKDDKTDGTDKTGEQAQGADNS